MHHAHCLHDDMTAICLMHARLIRVFCCILSVACTVRAAGVDPPSAAAGNPHEQIAPNVPVWRKHYLLANDTVQLEPCSSAHIPRAWRASRPAAQGSLQLPGTAAVQALIYAHQNPRDCSSTRFLVYQHPGHVGLGALMDNLADALAWAMSENRVLLLDYPSSWTRGDRAEGESHHRQSYCHGGALSLDACYFEPVSSCSLLDVYGPEVAAEWGRQLDTHALHEARKKLHGDRFYFNAVTGQNEHGKIPPQVQDYTGPITKGVKIGGIMSELFWWRAQGVAYVCRLNGRTLQVVRGLKAHFFKGQSIQPGTVSVHIRRGNKVNRQGGGEMGYVTDDKYIKYAMALQSGSKDMLKQGVFVSTEDPSAVQALQQNMTGWQVQYTTVPRNNHQGQAVI